MIHMARMTQLVDHDVAQMPWIEKHQAIIEADRATARVAAPAGLLPAHMHPRKRIPGEVGQCAQARKVLFPGQ